MIIKDIQYNVLSLEIEFIAYAVIENCIPGRVAIRPLVNISRSHVLR